MRKNSPLNTHNILKISILALSFFSVFDTKAEVMKDKTTALRVVGEPQGTFQPHSGVINLNSIKANVKNVGDYPAKNVKVVGISPNGAEFPLDGPAELGPNKQESYSGAAKEVVANGKKIKAKATCINCR